MVKSIANFAQINVKKLFRYSAIRMKPMFGVTPESFNAVDMVPSPGFSLIFSDNNMVAANRQGNIRLPIISVVQTPRFGVGRDQLNDLFFITSPNRKHSDFPVSLEYSQDDHLTGGTPSPLTRMITTDRCLIAFYGSTEGFTTLLFSGATCTDLAKKTLNGRSRCNPPESKPIARNSIDEKFDQFPLGRIRQSAGRPYAHHPIPGPTGAAFGSSISKVPTPSVSTFRASSHLDQNTQCLVQFV